MVISRFIQPSLPLSPLKLMAQSRRGVAQVREALHPQYLIKYRRLTT
ncbi:hypothetical protein [uncultured Gammaproteobacteria bacterium]|nr:hypothetical protein [uncultured Gammaproteobacteria bacterium]CAC9450399.1 hypothetical protein [uncultured Gammaproteobacteria bacterium]